MIAQAVKAFALIAAVATSVPAQTPGDTTRGRFSGDCLGSFSPPAALVMVADRPVAFGRANVAEIFAGGFDTPDYALQKFCHVVADVVGAAADARGDGAFLIATPRTIERVTLLPGGTTWIPSTLVPALGSLDRVQAVATSARGQIAVAVSTNGDPAAPRFLVYDRGASGSAQPLRDYTTTLVTSAVSALAFDTSGGLYAYDDAGEIIEFASNATGANPTPLRRIAGPATLLRPAIAGPHGKRPLTIDGDGNIVAADDRFVMTFAKDADGDATPLRTLTSRDRVYGLATDSRGYLYELRANPQGDNPTTSIKIFDPAAHPKPVKEDTVST